SHVASLARGGAGRARRRAARTTSLGSPTWRELSLRSPAGRPGRRRNSAMFREQFLKAVERNRATEGRTHHHMLRRRRSVSASAWRAGLEAPPRWFWVRRGRAEEPRDAARSA